jgi:hypothetical protein
VRAFEAEEFDRAVELLYEVAGCDSTTGKPPMGKLIELGLDRVEDLLKGQTSNKLSPK